MELLKLVLVDDETIILRGLMETYDWEQMGFKIVGTAGSGQEAIDVIRRTEPDVVLTDIRMKQISGLMVMEEMQKLYPDMLFIFLSAYRDFEYAQKACEMGAFTYLLKPVEEELLTDTMLAAHQKCMEEKQSKEQQENWQQLLVENSDNFLEVIIYRYLTEQITGEKIEEVFGMLDDIVRKDDFFLAVCVNIDISYKITNQLEYEAARFSLFQYLDDRFIENNLFWSFDGKGEERIYLLKMQDGFGVKDIRNMMQEAKKSQNYDIISSLSHMYKGIEGLKKAYEESLRLFEIASISGAGAFALEQNMDEKEQKTYSSDKELMIINAVRKNDSKGLKNSYINFIYSLPEEEEEQLLFIHTLMIQLEGALRNSYGFNDAIKENFKNYYANLMDLSAARAIDVSYKMLCNVIEERKKHTDDKEVEHFKEYMSVAIAYIEENLHDENLSIVSVASQIYLNSVYFGRVFKRTFQMTFKQYLMKKRMEKAKKLILEGNDSMGEICEKVGISNPSYFSQLFKSHTGLIPSEFKKQNEANR